MKKDPTFIWSPQGIMMDENGANKNAIRQVLGDEMAKRSWGCKWHCFQCTKCQNMKIKASDRKEFLNLAYALAKNAVTKKEYFYILTKLKEMCTTNLCMKWLKFWYERCEHFVPAHHGSFLPSMNIAESGQSGMLANSNMERCFLLLTQHIRIYQNRCTKMQCLRWLQQTNQWT